MASARSLGMLIVADLGTKCFQLWAQGTIATETKMAEAMAKPQGEVGFIRRRDRQRSIGLVLFVAMALVCLGWTLWLLALTITPNALVNSLMNTEMLDFGLFWLVVDPPTEILAFGVVGLGGVALGHVALLLQLSWNIRQRRVAPARSLVHVLRPQNPTADGPISPAEATGRFSCAGWISQKHVVQVALQKRSIIPIKLVDLTLQIVSLVQLLEYGVPVPLSAIFAAVVAANALCIAVFVSIAHTHLGLTHAVVDFSFDLFVAVVFPIITLLYSTSLFTFDRELMQINLDVFPTGTFEQAASVVADPVEVAVIRHTIDSLRIDTVLKAFTRIGTSITLWYDMYKLGQFLKLPDGFQHRPSIYPSQHRRAGAFFVAIAIAVVVFTERSITTSTAACTLHPECVQLAHHWIPHLEHGDLARCPCISIIDRTLEVADYDEFMNPRNRTEKIALLATQGYLQLIQMVNRELTYLPEELRRCRYLRYLSLYRPGNLEFPDWFRDFEQLEFLHVEGQLGAKSIGPLRPDLFDKMQSLSLLHFGSHHFPSLPSFDKLENLKSLNVAALVSVTELPSFHALRNLERLVIIWMHEVLTLPDFDNLHKLKILSVTDRGAFCCDGFLGPDRCNLSHSLCGIHPVSGSPAVKACVSPNRQASPATRAVFDKFQATACYGEALQPGQIKLPPTRREMLQCNGTMYRECQVPDTNITGMCYNARWTGVACDPSPFSLAMRRRQIAEGHGTPCNPSYEKWLGCRSS